MHLNSAILKRDETRQMILVAPVVPDEIDTQGDFYRPATVEKIAHRFMVDGNLKAVSILHNGRPVEASVVESYIAKEGDPNARAGTWLTWIKILDPKVWEMVLAKTLNGVSIEALASKAASFFNGKQAKEITDAVVTTLSLVDRPANRKPILMTKSAKPDPSAILAQITDSMARLSESIAQTNEKLEQQARDMAAALQPRDPRNLTKAQAEISAKTSAEIRFHQKRIAALHRSIEGLWEGELSGLDEATLRREIAKSELELDALGYSDTANINDRGRCVFYARGGTSNFLQESASFPDDLFGISQSTRKLQKDAGDVDLDCLVI